MSVTPLKNLSVHIHVSLSVRGKTRLDSKDLLRVCTSLHGPNFQRDSVHVQLLELAGSVLGFPLPSLPAGSVYSVALAMSLSASSGCDQLPRLGKLWRNELVNLVCPFYSPSWLHPKSSWYCCCTWVSSEGTNSPTWNVWQSKHNFLC